MYVILILKKKKKITAQIIYHVVTKVIFNLLFSRPTKVKSYNSQMVIAMNMK